MDRPLDALHPDHPPDNIAALVVSLHRDSCDCNRERFEAQQQELAFSLRFRHYKYDKGRQTDQRQAQPHAPELFSLQRYKAGEILAGDEYIECRPQNPGDDNPGVAENTKIALESSLFDPQLGFPRARRRAVIGMLAARAWIVAADAVRGIGKYGEEVVYRTLPRWRFHIAPGWQDMHDLTCPWVIEETDMRLGDIRRMGVQGWTNVEKVRADGHAQGRPVFGAVSQGPPLGASNQVDLTAKGSGDGARPSETDTALVLKCWFRKDDELEERPGTPRTLERDYHVQTCPLCGHTTEPGPSQPPDEHVEMCPGCGAAPLMDTTEVVDVDLFEKYPNGRLVIVAPGTIDGETGAPVKLYDGPWPYKMRSFPYAHYRCYEDPIEQEGQSETSIHWWSILILNGIRRFGWEQMRRNVDLMIALKGALEDAQGRPWSFNDLHGQVAWVKDVQSMQGVKHVQGSGVAPGLLQFHEMMLAPFRSATGTQDLALSPEQSRDIPVGTIQQLSRVGNVPVRQHREMIDEENSIFYGVVLDMLVQCWGPARWMETLGPNGVYELKELRQAALSSLKVVVSAAPSLSDIRSEEIGNFKEFVATMASDPAAGILLARLQSIPMSLVRDYMQNRAKVAAAFGGAPTPGTPPPGKARPGLNGGNPPIANGALTSTQ